MRDLSDEASKRTIKNAKVLVAPDKLPIDFFDRIVIESPYTQTYTPTIGVEIYTSENIGSIRPCSDKNKKYIRLFMWCLAWSDRFDELRKHYFLNSHGLLMMFNQSSLTTYEKQYYKAINELGNYICTDNSQLEKFPVFAVYFKEISEDNTGVQQFKDMYSKLCNYAKTICKKLEFTQLIVTGKFTEKNADIVYFIAKTLCSLL